MYFVILVILGGLAFAIAVTRTAASRCVAAVCVLGLAFAIAPGRSVPGQPADTVSRFFAAIEAGDCTAARAELSTAYRVKLERVGCDELVDEIRAFPLEAVLATTTDGRDRSARLVTIRLEGRERDVVVRVERERERWKIFSI